MKGQELKQAIKDAEDIAKNGTQGEKAEFVEWACDAIRWNSEIYSKEGKEALKAVEMQYKAYLNALKK